MVVVLTYVSTVHAQLHLVVGGAGNVGARDGDLAVPPEVPAFEDQMRDATNVVDGETADVSDDVTVHADDGGRRRYLDGRSRHRVVVVLSHHTVMSVSELA